MSRGAAAQKRALSSRETSRKTAMRPVVRAMVRRSAKPAGSHGADASRGKRDAAAFRRRSSKPAENRANEQRNHCRCGNPAGPFEHASCNASDRAPSRRNVDELCSTIAADCDTLTPSRSMPPRGPRRPKAAENILKRGPKAHRQLRIVSAGSPRKASRSVLPRAGFWSPGPPKATRINPGRSSADGS